MATVVFLIATGGFAGLMFALGVVWLDRWLARRAFAKLRRE